MGWLCGRGDLLLVVPLNSSSPAAQTQGGLNPDFMAAQRGMTVSLGVRSTREHYVRVTPRIERLSYGANGNHSSN